MLTQVFFIIAGFTAPVLLPTNPQSLLWLLPLTASLAVVYKATKLPKITLKNFIREVITLTASIVVFLVITAVVLHIIAWLIIE